ncbi:hypothetical protein LguiB_013016 [Lonicera macranthoides]
MVKQNSIIFLLPLLFIFFFKSSIAASITYNVVSLGAKADGKSDSSKAFLSAWAAACGSANPATIYVPNGRFLLGNITFAGQMCKNTRITFRIDGTLVAPSNYNVIGNSGNWIKFQRVTGVSILGGTLDGQGTNLWSCKNSGKNCPNGATSLGIYNSNNIVVNHYARKGFRRRTQIELDVLCGLFKDWTGYSKMPPKTSKRPTSRGPMDQLRQSVAQRSAAIASRGASDHEVAPPPLELQLITGQVPSTQHSSATSTSTTGLSFPRSIRCKSGNTSTSTSTSTHTRGIVVGKKTREEVRKHGKIKLEWSDELKLPSS